MMPLPRATLLWIRPGRLGSLGSGRSACRTPSCCGPRRGGGEDKGRRFALAGTDQSPLSQAIRARGSIAARDMA